MIRQFYLMVVILVFPALGMGNDYVGKWQTVDENTGEPQSIVYIWEAEGELKGRIDSILRPEDKGAVCSVCKGELKGQSVEGMTFIWGMKASGNEYDNGSILDPDSGKIYSASFKLIDSGKKLEVHGYLGFALLGKTQVWHRTE